MKAEYLKLDFLRQNCEGDEKRSVRREKTVFELKEMDSKWVKRNGLQVISFF